MIRRFILGALGVCLMLQVGFHSSTAGAQRPTFLGWYTGGSAGAGRLDRYSTSGVNTVVALQMSGPTLDAFLTRAAQDHVQVLVQPPTDWARTGNMDALQAFIEKYRTNPAVYGWYLYDEPDMNGLAPRKLVAAYKVVKSLDNHPVAVVFMSGDCRIGHGLDRRYLGGFDLLMFDRYPFYTFTKSQDGLKQWSTVTKNCVASARQYHKIGPIMVAQAFGNMKDGDFTWRTPTSREERTMFRGALTSGAQGVLFFYDVFASQRMANQVDGMILNWSAATR